MTVYDLNRDQLEELKTRYYADKVGRDISYDEIYNIDELVSDSEIYEEYAGTDFVPDDFFCSAGEDDCWEFTLRDNPIYGSREDIAQMLIAIAQDIRNGGVNGRVHAVTWKMERDNW